MSFIKRAQEAAAQAAAQAAAAAAGSASGRQPNDQATADVINRGIAGAGASAREAVGMARRGVTTVIEKIDPGTLAELIVKATALQEMTNKSLRTKGSPYRISEISISASIPPAVSFAISRLDEEPEEVGDDVVSSTELVEQAPDAAELVVALDGTTVDSAASPVLEDAPEAMPPSTISTGA